ncbi:MAG: DNA polymerase III subunit [Blautia sp.]|nr:DNA polymerase III subunit [Blautia sp.]
MVRFEEMVGHEEVIGHLQSVLRSRKVSHSYALVGETGAGKKMLSRTFAAALLCEKGGDEPCMQCDSCKRAQSGNHPDIITVTHEKENLIRIEEIREQLVGDVAIKPYYGPYKIYIVPDAQLLNEAAQNAMLKTIEEPPAYAVILLLTTNYEALLPTIRSRCVRLDLRLVDNEKIKSYLMEHLHLPDYEAELDASFGQGSIGKAMEAARSEEFRDISHRAVTILKKVDSAAMCDFPDIIREISENKEYIGEYLDLFQFWFRDVLMYKATREMDHLVFKQELGEIRRQAGEYSYEKLNRILDSVEKTRLRLRANVNAELSLELLLLTIKEN